MDTKTLVEQFARHVAAQGDCIRDGDSRKGNKHARKYGAALEALLSQGDAGREALSVLLKHPRADVRGMTASFLLRYRTKESKAVLEAIAAEGGLAAIGATLNLQRWAEGTWSLDPG
ncbi:DUF2019 domain-containing protein [Corallococcus exiguus]|uniref:DUF2019 domain-containing protein n=1 Tax=Corallococcus exiguus TaxID=83462 RepID=A0A7X5BRD4_9BACT|nr:DUF2019 domain-containing protein [Corallococcus exiguus]NBC40935.1 DUF2019 domain-containing protein [Corallococcus exiguus]TNV64850.1 DUF2019 domain-containing protein [Corallococcus exiguus]